MARTSKMNMIMHGDGHGGYTSRRVHQCQRHLRGPFRYCADQPPFGANVEAGDIILETEIAVKERARELYVAE